MQSSSKAKVPTRMMHSSSTSSSAKPTINNLCNNSNNPAVHKSAHATSLSGVSKAAKVPIASTRMSGRSQHPAAKWTNSRNQSSSPPRPAPRMTERRRFRRPLCEAAWRSTFNITGSALWIARITAFAKPAAFTSTAQQASSAAKFSSNAAVSVSTWLSRDFTASCSASAMRPGAVLARLDLERWSVVNWYNVLNATFFDTGCWHAAWSFAGSEVWMLNVLCPRWSKERL
mmetsp:Transcript_9885/g.28113  ORF Transcript_9885/g.28113 Transcript_9885/m.28113 type:complete len:230 (+) Transcript_9885:812-1501(+)